MTVSRVTTVKDVTITPIRLKVLRAGIAYVMFAVIIIMLLMVSSIVRSKGMVVNVFMFIIKWIDVLILTGALKA